MHRNEVFDMSVDAYAFGFIFYEVSTAFCSMCGYSAMCTKQSREHYLGFRLDNLIVPVIINSDLFWSDWM